MRKVKTGLALIIVVTGFAVACSKGSDSGNGNGNGGGTPPTNSCDGVNATFAADVSPIIQANCASGIGCHGDGSRNGPGALTSFAQIKNSANNIRSAVVSRLMPLGGSLSAGDIQKISCWVDSGAPNN